MTTPHMPTPTLPEALQGQLAAALARIAPTWPLDQFIAVNPYWGWVGQPLPEAAAWLGTLAGTRLTAPRAWLRTQWEAGHLTTAHLQAALDAHGTGSGIEVPTLVAALESPDPPVPRLPLLADLRDAEAPAQPGLRWSEAVTHQVSQHCAAYFDRHQSSWTLDVSAGLYESWRRQLAADRALSWRTGRQAMQARMTALPAQHPALIAAALDRLAIPEEGRVAYLSAVLLSINGWAAWCAYERWQAQLAGRDDDTLEQLLAIRLAWEWLLLEDAPAGTLTPVWPEQWRSAQAAAAALQQAQHVDWLLQNALEIAYQQPLIAALSTGPALTTAPTPPRVQAAFCIDVRSEVLRRALESTSAAVQTRGFAGFFGLPIAYSPIGSALVRPQLPGLLPPTQCVSDTCTDGAHTEPQLVQQRQRTLTWRQRWARFRTAPATGFTFVESLGLLYGAKLLWDGRPSTRTPERWEDSGLPAGAGAHLRPCLPLAASDPAAAAQMAEGILRAMGLVQDFAPLVLLTGHGSQTANNPHAAGLDCGACGGQTGEVNARVLADLLNRGQVRRHLRERGIAIPEGTHFLPALHNTTTDEVTLLDTATVPHALQTLVEQLRGWLAVAADRARAERAAGLGLCALQDKPIALRQALQERANDWAQVRPEWGLADNASFLVAPRSRTRGLNLHGRSFLHDYDYRLDPDGAVLTLIMTAPMVVTNWINLQYHASTVDNRRYGSGNKLLHNVVGGRLGVFEGNGGDLRIGLPLQSLHDGKDLRHTPLRLSVFIEAPRERIDAVLAQHETVRQLVGNGWLHLFRIDTVTHAVERHYYPPCAAA